MKKKLMMVAVLMGALTLGACVDNNETQSVTDVRNAKAEQLKARADMNNAEAEALNVLAAAEAQLMNAKAAAAKANAAKANAEAATINKKAELVALQKEAAELENEAAKIENQKAQAALEAALSDLEVAKKKAEQQLDSIAGQLEADKLKWEAELAAAKEALSVAEQALITTQDQVDATEKGKLLALAGAYSLAVKNLIDAQKDLVNAKNSLLTAEEDLVSVEEQKAEAILNNNNSIAQWELQIAAYKEYHNYLESATIDSLQAELTKLNAKALVLEDAYNNATKLFNDAEIDYDTINGARELFVKDAVFEMIYNNVIVLTDEEGNEDRFYLRYEDCTMNLTSFIPSWNDYTNYGKLYTYESEEYNTSWSEYIGDSLVFDVAELSNDIRQIELAINENIERWGGYLEGYEKTLANLQAQYNGKATEVIGYDADGKEIVKEIRNAVDSTAYLKNAYEKETDATKKATLRSYYEAAIAREKSLLDEIDFYTMMVKGDSRKVTAMKAWLEMFLNWDANIAALNEKIENYNNVNLIAYKAKVDAWYVQTEAEIAQMANDAAKDIITTQLNYNYGTGAVNLENSIKQIEKNIANAKKNNEDLSSIESKEEMVEYAKMRVAACEAVVAACEVAVTDAKAALDAAMPKEEE
ncbi:MAG: hypothetical protein E7099_05755 [Mediterranea massiliensis]|nr:hypothetical protein [Mediterranea massiliensis]